VQHRGARLEYIEVERADIALANRLAHEVLGRTLDEMPPQTRKLLVLLRDWLTPQAKEQGCKIEELRFTRRDVRSALKWGDTQLKIHLARLLEMEYLLLCRRGLTYEYGLLWDGEDNNNAHLCGLLEVGKLPRSGVKANQSVAGRGMVGNQSGSEKAPSSQAAQGVAGEAVGLNTNAVIRAKNNGSAALILHAGGK
jgi:hypothetical protein